MASINGKGMKDMKQKSQKIENKFVICEKFTNY
jgi:hypothetical protein